MIHIIDTYAWIEYFIGSSKGEVLRKLLLHDGNKFLTVECCLGEIKGWALRNNDDFDRHFRIIRANSDMLPIMEHDWILAGQERFDQRKTQKDFGLIDAAILVKQKELDCKLISGDKHFKNLKNIIFLY